jgi:uncharacterized protein (TIGR03083 family)
VHPTVPKSAHELPPIRTAHLFFALETKLLELLRSLSAEDWERQTLAPQWKVRQVVAHLLDTALRRLSMERDGYFSTGPKSGSPEDLRDFINELNRMGISVYGRLSAQNLIALMEVASRELCQELASLDPHGKATFAVSWAGESESEAWFDIAREYTERWHHQQQIREAVGGDAASGIMTPELYHPVLDTFMRALPHAYRNIAAPEGTRVAIAVTGDCGGEWNLVREAGKWALALRSTAQVSARVDVPQEIAWRIFTKGVTPAEAESRSALSGDRPLAQAFFRTIAIVG